MRAVGSPAVPARSWRFPPTEAQDLRRSRRARNQGARLTFCQRASSIAYSFVRGPPPLALRTSSWWTKNSLRLGSRRTDPMRKKHDPAPAVAAPCLEWRCLLLLPVDRVGGMVAAGCAGVQGVA